MDRKSGFIRILEFYLNTFKKRDIELMYGKGTKIKIKEFEYSTNLKSLFVESRIVLGDEINESVFDRSLADLIIIDAVSYIYPDVPVKISVDFDV